MNVEDEVRKPTLICLIVQLHKASSIQRVSQTAPAIIDMVKRWSRGEMEQLCRSNDGQLFGFFCKTSKPLDMIRAEFERSPATLNDDSLIAFAVGEGHAGVGFSRAWTWLQHHQTAPR